MKKIRAIVALSSVFLTESALATSVVHDRRSLFRFNRHRPWNGPAAIHPATGSATTSRAAAPMADAPSDQQS